MNEKADAAVSAAAAGAMIPHALHIGRIFAATLRPMNPGELAAALRRSTEAAWYLDPTAMRNRGTVEDIARKQRLLDAAAAFVAVVTEVEAEAARALPTASERAEALGHRPLQRQGS